MNETNLIVKKNNRYIRSTLCFNDAQEKKIILLAISKIDNYKKQGIIKTDEEAPIDFYLSVSEIKDFLGIKTNDIYRQLRIISSKIASRMIEFENGENEFAFLTPFPYAHYKSGVLNLRSEVAMFNTLVNYNDKSGFTQFLLANVKNLKSSYSISTYELLRSYLYLKTLDITVEDFKMIIGVIECVPKNPRKPLSSTNRELIDKFPRYADLKRRVLEQVKNELNEYTDIKFTYKEKKLGRKVNSLVFTIEENQKGVSLNQLNEYKRTRICIPKEFQSLAKEVKAFLPTTTKNKDILELLEASNYDVKKIKEIYEYTLAKGGRVRSKVPYMIKGLRDGWLENQNANTDVDNFVELPIDNKDENNLGRGPKGTEASIPNTTNKFHAFPQREYTKGQMIQMELNLLNRE